MTVPRTAGAQLGGLLEGVAVPWRVATLNVSLLGTKLSRAEGVQRRVLLASAGLSPNWYRNAAAWPWWMSLLTLHAGCRPAQRRRGDQSGPFGAGFRRLD
ncbi:hypothetical protein [Deinococcus hopiensis]|uniref:Uncharacterized protein n=1 Tax=Deinococcus hopiensis KR-140 TaxID=695939 RepID=A0A1W1VPI4_9DEIO|nr:hypothetical protein [Deinococcus hopiensis]SMB95236.1 hypothetical protein SAMN00790413_02754 [Deinococcus hopiensis KR-140]